MNLFKKSFVDSNQINKTVSEELFSVKNSLLQLLEMILDKGIYQFENGKINESTQFFQMAYGLSSKVLTLQNWTELSSMFFSIKSNLILCFIKLGNFEEAEKILENSDSNECSDIENENQLKIFQILIKINKLTINQENHDLETSIGDIQSNLHGFILLNIWD